jgi:hypothetical protein
VPEVYLNEKNAASALTIKSGISILFFMNLSIVLYLIIITNVD